MMIYARGIEGSGTGDTGQEKGTGASVLTTHDATVPHFGRLGLQFKRGRRKRLSRGGGGWGQ